MLCRVIQRPYSLGSALFACSCGILDDTACRTWCEHRGNSDPYGDLNNMGYWLKVASQGNHDGEHGISGAVWSTKFLRR